MLLRLWEKFCYAIDPPRIMEYRKYDVGLTTIRCVMKDPNIPDQFVVVVGSIVPRGAWGYRLVHANELIDEVMAKQWIFTASLGKINRDFIFSWSIELQKSYHEYARVDRDGIDKGVTVSREDLPEEVREFFDNEDKQ